MKYIFIILITLFPLHVQAEEKLNKPLLQRMIQPKVSLQSSYLDDANVKGYAGSVSVRKNRLMLNNEIAGISYTNWSFLWNNIGALPFGNGVKEPIKQMHRINAKVTLPYKINDDWFLLTSLSVRSTFEKEMSDSYGLGVFSFASYKINEDHEIQIGAFANYHPTETLALPVLGYSYRARKKDGFQFVLGFPRTYAGYHYTQDLLFRLGVVFSQALIKLRKDSTIELDGYIEAKDYMSSFGVAYELNENVRIDADLLYSLKRELIIYSKNSIEVNEYSIDPSLGASVRLNYRF